MNFPESPAGCINQMNIPPRQIIFLHPAPHVVGHTHVGAEHQNQERVHLEEVVEERNDLEEREVLEEEVVVEDDIRCDPMAANNL